MPENTTTPAIPHGQFQFDTARRGLIRAFVLGPEQVREPTLHTGKVIVERHDVPQGDPRRFAVVDVYSHDNGRTWAAENIHYDLSYNDAVRRLIQVLTGLIPTVPDWFINRPRTSETNKDMPGRKPQPGADLPAKEETAGEQSTPEGAGE